MNPTHRDRLTGALVFAAGHDAATLEKLPRRYWRAEHLRHAKVELVAATKAGAMRRIEAVAPVWKQLNDLADPPSDGSAERRAHIDAVRAWSNEREARIAKARTLKALDIIAKETTT